MTSIVLPNVRKLFLPDVGYTIFDADLAGADAQVVAWEAEDEDLKAAFRARLDVHHKNATDMWGESFTKLDPKSDAYYKKRQSCKHAVHGTNYGGSPRTVAAHPAINWTVHEADQFQKRWFSLHPGIKTNFHGKVEASLRATRSVKNPFGFQRVFFDRIDACFPEALAWIPQSTVALNTYLGAFQLEAKFSIVQILLQVHDSLVFQFPTSKTPDYNALRSALAVTTPYSDPLIIPWGLAASDKSWGEVKKV